MAFLDIENRNFKENVGVTTALKNENAATNSIKAKKSTILCDVANTVNRNRATLEGGKKSMINQIKASSVRKPRTVSEFMSEKQIASVSKLQFRKKTEYSAKFHEIDVRLYDGQCNSCSTGKGINSTIPPLLSEEAAEKLALDPFPRRNKVFEKKQLEPELIMPPEAALNDFADFHDDFRMVQSLPQLDFVLEDVPPVYDSDIE